MIIKKNFLALLAFVCGNCCFTAALQGEESQILFQAYKGNVSLALMRYREPSIFLQPLPMMMPNMPS